MAIPLIFCTLIHTTIVKHTHTHLNGSPVLAWRWRDERCQHQQMPRAPILEGLLFFVPRSPFEIHGLCVLLFFVFGLEILCHFGRFYLSASVWVRGLGFVLESHGNKGWRYNQRGPVVSVFSQGRWVTILIHFTYSSCCYVEVHHVSGVEDQTSVKLAVSGWRKRWCNRKKVIFFYFLVKVSFS